MGSAGSGNFGHAGRPGERGGSTPGVGDRVYYRHQGVTKVGRITDTQGQVGSRGLKIENDRNKEIHTVPESNLVGNSATSAAIWNKEHTGMRVNPGTKAPGAKAAAVAGKHSPKMSPSETVRANIDAASMKVKLGKRK